MSDRELDFGDYVNIEQKRFGVDNEKYLHKVIRVFSSNAYVSVPVQTPSEETLHQYCVPVVACICCGVEETEVRRYRIEDVEATNQRQPDQELVDALEYIADEYDWCPCGASEEAKKDIVKYKEKD